MLNILSRFQCLMVIVTAAMIVATGFSAIEMSKRHRLLDGLVSGTTIADVGDMISTINHFQNALATDRPGQGGPGRTRMYDALRTRLAAMRIGETAAVEQSQEEQAARDALRGAILELQLSAIDEDGPDMRTRMASILRDMQDALQTLAIAATSSLKHSVDGDLTLSNAALRQHLTQLAGTVLCGVALLLIAIRRGWAQHRLARRDSLTGLMNRLGFSETLARLISDPGPGNEVGLILLDLDLFKNINDSLGHAAGDLLLKEVAARLSTLASADVHVARLGGDEFALVIAARRAHGVAAEKVEIVKRLLVEPVQLGSKLVTAQMSIGVAVSPLGWYDAQSLLKNADIALYAAKAAGRGRSRSFTARMERDLQDKRQLEDDLRRAVSDSRIQAHFQPIVALRSGRVVKCEALARWERPGLGFVSPARFIAVAEETGLIREVGGAILLQACAAARTWPDEVRVSVNLSAHQFDDDLVPAVAAALAATGLASDRLELEITESVLVKDSAFVIRVLKDLRRLGVLIALDDFGTGFSSLSYLQRFPIDRIKIDQSFVRDMSDRPESAAIVESICLLAKKLGLSTTAEGIETEDQASLLRAYGCVEGQGYLFHRPMPLDACTATIAGSIRTEQAA